MSINRNHILKKHLSLGIVFKVLGIGIMYFTIPILVGYLGLEDYGIWVTLLSVINWFFFFDLGMGHGLKNKLTESLALENVLRSNQLITSSFFFISLLSILVFVIGVIGVQFIDQELIFDKKALMRSDFNQLLVIMLFFVSLGLVTNLFKQLYNSKQKTGFVQVAVFLVQLFFLILVICLGKLELISVKTILISYGTINILTNIFFLSVFFYRNKPLRPTAVNVNRQIAMEVMSLGKDFFIIQLSMLLILTGNNIIIIKLLGPEQVAIYDSVFKIFQFFLVFSALVFNPLWPLFTDAYIKKDVTWIKRVLKRLNYVFLGLIVVLFILSFFVRDILDIWLGKELSFSNQLIVYAGLFVAVRIFGDIYIYFINATGKIKLQRRLFLLAALMNIPLSILLITRFDMGIEGVMLSTVISILSLTILMPIQARKILREVKNENSVN